MPRKGLRRCEKRSQCLSRPVRSDLKLSFLHSIVVHMLKLLSPRLYPDQVGSENCKQFFSQVLAFITKNWQHLQRRWCPYDMLLFFYRKCKQLWKKVFPVFDTHCSISHVMKSMWNTLSVCLSRSTKSATKAISLALHSVSYALKHINFCQGNSKPWCSPT